MKVQQDSSKKHRKLTRRKFLLGTVALVGGGLGLRWLTHTEPKLATQPGVLEPNAYLQISPDGKFIFQLDRVEMGQGTMTGLTTLSLERCQNVTDLGPLEGLPGGLAKPVIVENSKHKNSTLRFYNFAFFRITTESLQEKQNIECESH